MKSVYTNTNHKTPSEVMETPDLDVTPVMNMFVILIPFLVSMAVFTHLAVINVSLPPNVGAGLSNADQKPRLKITIVVAPEYLAITYGEHQLDSIGRTDSGHNFESFANSLKTRRAGADITDEAIIAVCDQVAFEHVVAVMDRCRAAGFTKLGLSNAAAHPEKGV